MAGLRCGATVALLGILVLGTPRGAGERGARAGTGSPRTGAIGGPWGRSAPRVAEAPGAAASGRSSGRGRLRDPGHPALGAPRQCPAPGRGDRKRERELEPRPGDRPAVAGPAGTRCTDRVPSGQAGHPLPPTRGWGGANVAQLGRGAQTWNPSVPGVRGRRMGRLCLKDGYSRKDEMTKTSSPHSMFGDGMISTCCPPQVLLKWVMWAVTTGPWHQHPYSFTPDTGSVSSLLHGLASLGSEQWGRRPGVLLGKSLRCAIIISNIRSWRGGGSGVEPVCGPGCQPSTPRATPLVMTADQLLREAVNASRAPRGLGHLKDTVLVFGVCPLCLASCPCAASRKEALNLVARPHPPAPPAPAPCSCWLFPKVKMTTRGQRSAATSAPPLSPRPPGLLGSPPLTSLAAAAVWSSHSPLPGAQAAEIAVPYGSGVAVIVKLGVPAQPGKPCYITMSKKQVTRLHVTSGQRISFTFSCRDPENHYVLDIENKINCMSGPCPVATVQLQPRTSELPALNKTFTWDIEAQKSVSVELGFSAPRLRQVEPGERCPDGITHTIHGRLQASEVGIGTFCANGTVSRVKMQGAVKVALRLPWLHSRNESGFSIAARPPVKRLCIIESVFEGEGSATLMSANYPAGFPEDELMTWQFVVPAPLRASVSFLHFSLSNCERKEERVEYHVPGSATNPEVFRLGDEQPGNMAGNFNLSLQGCDQDAQNPGALRLKFQVLVQHPHDESNKTYVVDLSQERTLTLTIEPRPVKHSRQFVPGCFVCLESRTCSTNVTLAPGSKHKLSFLCDDLTRLWASAEKTISCLDPRYCHRKSYLLQVPSDILQLPVQLRDFSWKLLAAKDRLSLALAPAAKLQQHTQERPCNSSFSYLVAGASPGQDLYVGAFCPGGAVDRMLLRQNASVTLRTYAPGFRWDAAHQGLTVAFVPYFKEEAIFTVIPDMKSKVYLRTPNWDRGLPALSSVSWNISVPRDQVACLTFVKERSGVVCQSGRAFMILQGQQAPAEEVFSLEDDVLPKPSFHRHNFWVNISNCSPASGRQLDLLFWVALTPRTMDPTVVVAAVAGGVLLIFALGLTICCIKKKKKKRGRRGPAVGVYNGHVNTQVPRPPDKFQRGRRDNDSHVYAVIDDTMVYGHLLQGSGGSFLQPEVDTYRPFQGHMGDCPPCPPSGCSRTPTAKLSPDEPPPCMCPEPESEPYTFSHPVKMDVGPGDTVVPLLDTQQPAEPAE
ncbi:CUB domain-containing protein 1 [Ctenodactylus gundi]